MPWYYDFLVWNPNVDAAYEADPDFKKKLVITHYVRKNYTLDKFNSRTKDFYRVYFDKINQTVKKYDLSNTVDTRKRVQPHIAEFVAALNKNKSKPYKVDIEKNIEAGLDLLDNWM